MTPLADARDSLPVVAEDTATTADLASQLAAIGVQKATLGPHPTDVQDVPTAGLEVLARGTPRVLAAQESAVWPGSA